MIDGCAISLPCHREGEVPVGLMLASSAGADRRVSNSPPAWRPLPVFDLAFTIDAQGTTTPRTVPIDQAVIAGWTGAIPSRVTSTSPNSKRSASRGRLDADLLPRRCPAADHRRPHRGQRRRFLRRGRVRADRLAGPYPVGAGSDHTDRKVETYSVTVSKQMCEKVVAPVLWELEEVTGHWDRMILRSHAWIDGARVLYQEGTLDGMLPVNDLIQRGFWGGGTAGCLRHVWRHLCRQGRHPPRQPLRIELEDPRAEAQHSSRL